MTFRSSFIILGLVISITSICGAPQGRLNCRDQGSNSNNGGPAFECATFSAPTKIHDPTGYGKTIKPQRTTINIHLAKPELGYTAGKEEKDGQDTHTYQVTFNYEKLNDKSVHFSDDGQRGSETYSPVRGNIEEPRKSIN